MLAVLTYIVHAYKYKGWPTSTKKVNVHCNNLGLTLGLTQRITWHYQRIVKTPKDSMAPDYDIEAEITHAIVLLEKNKVNVRVRHVKGHQDKEQQYHNLTRESQLNVQADKQATRALRKHKRKEDYTQLPNTKAMLYIEGEPTTSKEALLLRRAYLSQNLRQYIIGREKWKEQTPDLVWWEAHKRSIQRLNPTDRTRIQKFIHRALPTNKKLNDQDKDHPIRCPSCTEIETNDHVFQCKNQKRQSIRGKTTKKMRQNFSKYNVHIKIQECIIAGIQGWLTMGKKEINDEELSFAPEGAIRKAVEDQNEIGWDNFYRGRWSLEWENMQDQ